MALAGRGGSTPLSRTVADAVIAQGLEAGGHVRGVVPALDLLERVRAVLPADYPVLVAGGIADAADVREALLRKEMWRRRRSTPARRSSAFATYGLRPSSFASLPAVRD